MAKWIIGIVVIVAAGAGLWYSGLLGKFTNPTPTVMQTATTTPETNQQAAAPAPINGMSANNDASDAAMAQDIAAIDAQITAYGTDSSNVDSSLNDKSTQ